MLRNPFPGLRPFYADESHLFFGRERNINEILRKLDVYHFVSVVGNSGSGKSSLVRAGVLPLLEKPGSEWLITTMRPGRAPIEELHRALFSLDDLGSDVSSEGMAMLGKSRLGLVQLIRGRLPEGKKLLILVDQFEELFRFTAGSESDRAEAFRFVDLLLGAVGQRDVPIYIMLTLRTDFLGECEQFPGLPEAINDGQFLIPRLNNKELQSTITGPVDYAGGRISPRLVQQLTHDAGNSPDQLPVLQHVMMRTWEVWEREADFAKPIDLEHYQQTGGLAKALSMHAEEAMADLKDEQERSLAEKLFRILTVKEPDGRGLRRPTSVGQIAAITGALPEAIMSVADRFRRQDRGFLMPPANVPLKPSTVLDISHESLMRVWERLSSWVNEEAESAIIYNRIAQSAQLYEDNLSGLWHDPDLQIALDWKKAQQPNEAWAAQYNPHYRLAMHFLDASLQHKRYTLAAGMRRRRMLQASVVAVVLALSALSIWAINERKSARQNEADALQAKLEAQKQKGNAVNQAGIAQQQKNAAETNLQLAQEQQTEAEKQRASALKSAGLAQTAQQAAEQSSQQAMAALQRATIGERQAVFQKGVSDSLTLVSQASEQTTNRLRLLSTAQNLAIRSRLMPLAGNEVTKPALALVANRLAKANGNREYDPELITSLYSAWRSAHPADRPLHKDAVRSLAYSHRGSKIASVAANGILMLTDAANPSLPPVAFPAQGGILDQVCFSEDDATITCTADDRSILIFTVANPKAKPVVIAGVHPQKITALLDQGGRLYTAALDNTIRVLDKRSGSVLQSATLPSRPLCMTYEPGRNLLVAGTDNGSILTIECSAPMKVATLAQANGQVKAVALDKTGKVLAYGTGSGDVVMQRPGQTALVLSGHKGSITALAFNPAKNELASASLDGTVRIWNLDHPAEAPLVLAEHESWVWDLAYRPDGKALASAGKDKTVRTYLVDEQALYQATAAALQRDLTPGEWETYVGANIPYFNLVQNNPRR